MVSANLTRILFAFSSHHFETRVKTFGKRITYYKDHIKCDRYSLVTVVYQKRLKKERRARKRLQEQLDLEIKRRTQLEEALKATGASSEQVRAITGTCESPPL